MIKIDVETAFIDFKNYIFWKQEIKEPEREEQIFFNLSLSED